MQILKYNLLSILTEVNVLWTNYIKHISGIVHFWDKLQNLNAPELYQIGDGIGSEKEWNS